MSQIGVIGLGTMGANLARNAARNGAVVAVFNRTAEKVEEFVRVHGKEGTFVPCNTLAKLTAALKTPRAILLMVKAGEAVDEVIAELSPLLSKGDILIDGGNSDERDTARREAELKKKGFRFLGMGVSGGERGALLGPSLMPGGDRSAYDELEPLLIKMAAKVGGGTRDGGQGNEQQKCVAFLGSGGVGHFVKMIHNGIEYGLMEAYAEGFNILRNAEAGRRANAADAETAPMSEAEFYQYQLDLPEIAELWRRGSVIGSWLLDLTAVALQKNPDLSNFSGRVSDSGEGRWTIDAAIDEAVPAPVLSAALFSRFSSRGEADFADRLLSALRFEFGGHVEQTTSG